MENRRAVLVLVFFSMYLVNVVISHKKSSLHFCNRNEECPEHIPCCINVARKGAAISDYCKFLIFRGEMCVSQNHVCCSNRDVQQKIYEKRKRSILPESESHADYTSSEYDSTTDYTDYTSSTLTFTPPTFVPYSEERNFLKIASNLTNPGYSRNFLHALTSNETEH
ncbi:uncharacterized protein [Parasteatoda tepidariorum]|uniref:uncharacterized protein n=1 Tax=Parasteatoda tepidariorum TaxID=114398 RepID=UPI001C71CF82|nr:uncharacterized protein LOC122270445 [Parasteatoda tepidariorum]